MRSRGSPSGEMWVKEHLATAILETSGITSLRRQTRHVSSRKEKQINACPMSGASHGKENKIEMCPGGTEEARVHEPDKRANMP